MDNHLLNIDLSIADNVSALLKHDYKKSILALLAVIPKEDLRGLKAIRVVLYGNSKKFPNARGLYDGFSDPNNCAIFLCIQYIFPINRRILFKCFPFLSRAYLGYVLYHELGHHHHNIHHGINMSAREKHANIYRKKYFYKWLAQYRLIKILRLIMTPFGPLIRRKYGARNA